MSRKNGMWLGCSMTKVWTLILVIQTLTNQSECFDFPSDTNSDIPIVASHTCSTGDGTCNTTCPTRTTTPSPTTQFVNVPIFCDTNTPSSPSKPNHVEAKNGIQFTNNTSSCVSLNMTNSLDMFTLTVWFYANCSSCTILSLGRDADVQLDNGIVSMGTNRKTVTASAWIFLAIRFDGKLTWFVEDEIFATDVTSLSDQMISFGPQTSLNSSEVVAFLEGNIYQLPLTVREINHIRTNKWLDLPVESECRCPVHAPYLVKETRSVQYLMCRSSDNTTVFRLNTGHHLAMFMIDKDPMTFWSSGPTTEPVKITLTLPRVYQIRSLALSGLQSIPDRLTVELKQDTSTSSLWYFQESCSQSNCKPYNTDIQTSKKFTYNFEENNDLKITADVDKLVTNTVVIKFETSATTSYQVSELELDVRCHCYGNDQTCTINDDASYSCNCNSASHMQGTHCDTCQDHYYRTSLTQLTCPNPCGCHLDGTNNMQACNKLGGQCPCKINTEGRTCSQCKHNTINLGFDIAKGCKQCTCNADGIEKCNNDGSCVCKPNVETASGRCTACKDDFYGIVQASGCSSCACDMKGTISGQLCNKLTGQCQCKTYVQGRTCNECVDGYYDLTNANPNGCQGCECSFIGSRNGTRCDQTTGQCPCLNRIATDRQCHPVIDSIMPLYGPMAGGTKVTISGKLLWKQGLTFTFSINDNPQAIKMQNESVVVVETSLSSQEQGEAVKIAWSQNELYKEEKTLPYSTFRYMKNPSITAPTQIFKSYASGGCRIDIAGDNFNSIYQPKLMVYAANQPNSVNSKCHRQSNHQIVCPTPNVTAFETLGNLRYGFWLDNVKDFNDLSSHGTFINVIEDPKIDDKQVTEYKNLFDTDIKVTGKDLNLACDDRDVRISIGGKDCPIKERTNDQIVCDPGEKFPGSSREEELMVYIGNLAVRQGIVKFKTFWTLPEFIAIVASVGVVIILFIIIVVFCKCVRRGKFDSRASGDRVEMREEKQEIERKANTYDKFPSDPLNNPNVVTIPDGKSVKKDAASLFIKRLESSVGKNVRSSLIDRTHIEPGQICTQKGTKIRLINGQFNASTSSHFAGNPLIIKTLVSSYSETDTLPSWLNDGLQESMRLQNCVNDNVLRMLGIAIDNKNVYILYPEMSNRSLKDYLSSAKQVFSNEVKLDLCVQVVEGMSYLSSENIVHRDLAARNCWISADQIVKIADSSFAYDLYPDEYLFQNGRHQPVRWMAPESLRQSGFYTSKTDVWSLGVVVWEIMTNGYLPYLEVMKNIQIKEYVCEKGYKLGRPHDCPDNVYSVIEQCQGDHGDARPSFSELLQTFTDIISPDGGAGDHLYQNQNQLQNEAESDMEIYMNSEIIPPPRMPKR